MQWQIKWILIFTAFIFLNPQLHADTITKVQGKQVLIETSSSFIPGDKVYSVDESGKKKAIIQISKVGKSKAIGQVLKGSASVGQSLQRASSKSQTEGEPKNNSSAGSNALALGFLAGIAFDSLSVKVPDASGSIVETVNMSGTGFSFKGMADWDFTSYLGLRALVGLEKFAVSATATQAICDGTDKCKTEIQYLTVDALLRYAFIEGSFKMWAGAGVGMWMPSSKTSNSLSENSIGSTTAIYVSLGADLELEKTLFLPIQADYMMLPSSADVTASGIAIRAGMGFRF